jgi:hypothetical protein
MITDRNISGIHNEWITTACPTRRRKNKPGTAKGEVEDETGITATVMK